ncbi:MAG: cation diffusion facilitator family transporter, partial [Symbiobacteriaceae bacterium]|nr:cation diffusion facilitator family transporter [Symbiobacteriaceae bacterium]
MEQMRRVRHILLVILGLNLAVALAKVAYGWLSGSLSMTADGFHSLSDGASNLIGLVGVWIASIPADENHPYGHKKFETFTTVGIAALLLFVGFEVVLGAVQRIGGGAAASTPQISAASFVVMLITLAVNIGVYTYEFRVGKKLGSDFLVSDALHTRSDILVSL